MSIIENDLAFAMEAVLTTINDNVIGNCNP
jgi:hypothetical protein